MRAPRFLMRVLLSLGVCAVSMSDSLLAGDVVPSVSERFAQAEITEEPNFQKHVGPLFGRLGCNGRSCHGSFQGRGGFRLSLFGYDFKADHDELLKGEPLRANKDKPLESLMIVKPTDADMHEGGQRYKVGGWEYHLFRRWLEAGAKFEEKEVQKLVNLEVTPAEILFSTSGEKVQLKAIAVWPDGSREDVTCLCRFTSNSDQVATIDADGQVSAADPGDTHVVVAYDNAVIAIPVIRPVSQLTGDRYPKVATPTKVDELVVQKLKKLGIVQSDLCTDAEFLRRISLDLTGTLPTAAEVEQFLIDASPNKRTDKIEQLLVTPAYAAWWTTRISDWTGNNDTKFNNFGTLRTGASQQWYEWVYKRVAENMPYDQLVAGMVTGVSRLPTESYAEYCEVMSDIAQKEGGLKYADRPHMPYFWARQNVTKPEERAIGFAYTFLGIRIQCAQCHKHPFDQWSKEDFDDFRNFFGGVRHTNYGAPTDSASQEEYRKIVKEIGLENSELRGNQLRQKFEEKLRAGKTVPFPEVITTKASKNLSRKATTKKNGEGALGRYARSLGGPEIDLTQVDDAREPLMNWLREKDNPYFAKAFVNRVWENYFNVGIVNPPDDLSLANPPSNRPLLDHLAEGFLANGFDMKWVHREICNSRTYQLSWQTNETNAKEEKNFARAVPRRLAAEVAVDAISAAVASDEKASSFLTKLDGRAIAVAGASAQRAAPNNNPGAFALQVFGRSVRESNCDCDRASESSLLQTVYLQNDSSVLQALEGGKNSWIDQIAKADPANGGKRAKGNKKEDAADERELAVDAPTLIRQVYLRTVSRPPTDDEIARCTNYLAQADSPLAGAKGLLWALLNTKEFIVNH